MANSKSIKMSVGSYEYMKWLFSGEQSGENSARTWLNACVFLILQFYR